MSRSYGSSAPSSSPRSPGPISAASTSSPPRKASFSRWDRSRSSSRWRPAGSRTFASAMARSCGRATCWSSSTARRPLADTKGARAELASARAEILRRRTALVERAVASLRCRSGDRLAGRRSAGVARAREPEFSPPISDNWRRTSPRSTLSGRKNRPNATNCARPSRRRRTSSRPCRSASTCARSSSKRRRAPRPRSSTPPKRCNIRSPRRRSRSRIWPP